MTTSRRAQKMPYKEWIHVSPFNTNCNHIHIKAFTIQNNEVDYFDMEMNGFELNMACAVTMNGQSYIFQAAKQSNIYGQQYVLILGWVQRLRLG